MCHSLRVQELVQPVGRVWGRPAAACRKYCTRSPGVVASSGEGAPFPRLGTASRPPGRAPRTAPPARSAPRSRYRGRPSPPGSPTPRPAANDCGTPSVRAPRGPGPTPTRVRAGKVSPAPDCRGRWARRPAAPLSRPPLGLRAGGPSIASAASTARGRETSRSRPAAGRVSRNSAPARALPTPPATPPCRRASSRLIDKPEPGAAGAARPGGIGPPEPVEHQLLVPPAPARLRSPGRVTAAAARRRPRSPLPGAPPRARSRCRPNYAGSGAAGADPPRRSPAAPATAAVVRWWERSASVRSPSTAFRTSGTRSTASVSGTANPASNRLISSRSDSRLSNRSSSCCSSSALRATSGGYESRSTEDQVSRHPDRGRAGCVARGRHPR